MDGFFSKGMSLSGRITDLTSGNYVYIYIYPIPSMGLVYFPTFWLICYGFHGSVNVPFVPWVLCMGIWCSSGMKNDQPWRALPFLKSHLRYITRSLLRIRDFSYNPIVRMGCFDHQSHLIGRGEGILRVYLVGGFNPSEKYARQIGNLSHIVVKIKIFELPPTRLPLDQS